MKYYVKSPFGVESIISKKLKSYNCKKVSNINDADFIYMPITSHLQKNKKYLEKSLYRNATYVNNFIDSDNNLCKTSDNCLNNKYRFVGLSQKTIGKKQYIPNSYVFTRNDLNSISNLNYDKTYILKPENEFARKGITLVNSFDEIKNWLKQNHHERWVLQDYVSNPLLIDKKKFHFRMYLLMVQRFKTNEFEVYMYDKFFAFCAPIKYDLNSKDLTGHLTGAKYCDVRLVTETLVKAQNIDFYNKILPQFKEIAKDCGEIAKQDLNLLSNKTNSFHLFAADIIIDENYNANLLEVNNGCVGTEMNNLEKHMCKNGGTLHDTNTIVKLFEDMIEIVLQKDKNNNLFQLISSKVKEDIIEGFDSKIDSNYYKEYYLIVFLSIILICLITYFYIKNSKKI